MLLLPPELRQLNQMRTETEIRDAAWAEQHIAKFGHQAIYGKHDCPQCGLTWTCRKNYCKRSQESNCKACETATLLEEVQLYGKQIRQFLRLHDSSDARQLAGIVDGIIESARTIQEME